MKNLILTLGLVLIVVAVAAGGSVVFAQVTADDIVDVTWQWAEWTTTEPAGQSVVPDPENYTIVFRPDGEFNVKADCNMVGGAYTLDGDALTIFPGPSTMAFCGEESLDQIYLALLSNGGTVGLEGGRLVLNLNNSAGRMVFNRGEGAAAVAPGTGIGMSAILDVIANLAVLVFVVSSMLAMGLSLTIPQILAPLSNARLVILALVANFVIVPALAYGIGELFNLEEPLSIGLFLVGAAAGAPFLPKLAQVAKGDIAFAVGLMVLLMVVTIIFLPIVLPLVLEGVEVNPRDIAGSLVVLMLIPLGIGLFVRSRYQENAGHLQETFGQAANLALLVMMVALLVLNYKNMISLIGTGGIIAGVAFIVAAFAVGYVLGGPGAGSRSVLGLGTGQRNISAAFVVAAQNFDDPNVLVMLMVVSLIGLVILMPLGAELGKRAAE
jgi:predicted Na+-dependent transporter/heat shock protein HslJ